MRAIDEGLPGCFLSIGTNRAKRIAVLGLSLRRHSQNLPDMDNDKAGNTHQNNKMLLKMSSPTSERLALPHRPTRHRTQCAARRGPAVTLQPQNQ